MFISNFAPLFQTALPGKKNKNFTHQPPHPRLNGQSFAKTARLVPFELTLGQTVLVSNMPEKTKPSRSPPDYPGIQIFSAMTVSTPAGSSSTSADFVKNASPL